VPSWLLPDWKATYHSPENYINFLGPSTLPTERDRGRICPFWKMPCIVWEIG